MYKRQITYTILDFPDLTVDGSFPLGAALSAVLITKGVNPVSYTHLDVYKRQVIFSSVLTAKYIIGEYKDRTILLMFRSEEHTSELQSRETIS